LCSFIIILIRVGFLTGISKHWVDVNKNLYPIVLQLLGKIIPIFIMLLIKLPIPPKSWIP
jgi:hypothetical protein